ncbi:MAG TPA: ZPR1 zinc finger domain-containing protein [Acidobacteriota bacterium]|nr:ZPR1 zinc finger domain-containing protein [Acidobacteriota bacterium]
MSEQPTNNAAPSNEGMGEVEIIHGETCPICNKKTLTLMDSTREIPFFGLVHLFSMTCSNQDCKYHKADVEPAEEREPCSITFTISSEADMNVRVVKSAGATVKLPRILTMESSELSNGYISNIEGLLNRAKKVLEEVRDTAEDDDDRRKAKNLLKKIQDIMWGREELTITIEDPTGCSAIISDKAVVKKMAKKKVKAE